MSSLFILSKGNKRPLSDVSQSRPDERSAPPPPGSVPHSTHVGYSNGGAGTGGGAGGSSTGHAIPRPRTALPSLGNPSSRNPSQRPTALTAPTIPFPNDASLKAKLESILRQIIRLFQLESQTLEASSTAGNGSFEVNDLASEEADELKRCWEEGFKGVTMMERREKEKVGNAMIEDLGGLLMLLVNRVGTNVLDRRVDEFKRDLEKLKSSSSQTLSARPDQPMPPPSHLPSSQSSSRSDTSLSDALSRIRALEEQLKRSDQEREQLRKELRAKDDNLEQRLSALENRTVDPRRRVSSTVGNTSGPSPALSPSLQGTLGADLDKLRQDVKMLEKRLLEAESRPGGEGNVDGRRSGKADLDAVSSQVKEPGAKLVRRHLPTETAQLDLANDGKGTNGHPSPDAHGVGGSAGGVDPATPSNAESGIEEPTEESEVESAAVARQLVNRSGGTTEFSVGFGRSVPKNGV